MKKQVIIALMFVVFLFLVSFLFAFLYAKNKVENKDDLLIDFNPSNVVLISNKLPISDILGKDIIKEDDVDNIHEYILFSLKNTNDFSVEYEIYLTKKELQTNWLNDNYVKFYLTDDKDIPYEGFKKNKVPSYADFSYLSDKPNSKLLYRGVLRRKESSKFKLRAWLSDSYVIANYVENFGVDINVRIK